MQGGGKLNPSGLQAPGSLKARILECRPAFGALVLTSGAVNLLYLTSSLFMLQVFDRVLGSQSIPTLVALALVAIAAYAVQAMFDVLRHRLLTRAAEHVDWSAGTDLFAASLESASGPAGMRESLQPFRDLDAVRAFGTSGGLLALLDMPWMPIYFLLVFILHPLLGWLCLGGAGVLVVLALVTEMMTRRPAKTAAEVFSERNHLMETAQRGADVVRAMGMTSAIAERWAALHRRYLQRQRLLADRATAFAMSSRAFRHILQSAVLGLAAYLAIRTEISMGAIIASSILSSRALAPIDMAIGNWKGFLSARDAWQRLRPVLAKAESEAAPLALPKPKRELAVEHLFVAAPGETLPIVANITLKIPAGSALGIIGPSASGKSTLARALVGLWPELRGRVLLDGAALSQWPRAELGRHVGYLPQDVQLFDGTIGENIARFGADAKPEEIIKASQEAGFHEHILDLADGYGTRVGSGGSHLSSGQRQRLGLARALYGSPFLVVLDEPNANLDAEGERAVAEAILHIRQRGGIAVVVAHRPSAIQAIDLLLVLKKGQMAAFGPRDEILEKALQGGAARLQPRRTGTHG